MDEKTKAKIATQYYEKGTSPLTDSEWDKLYEDNETVGYTSKGSVTHTYPLLSLQKTFSREELYTWRSQFTGQKCIATPKLDGSAVSLQYWGGELIKAATRGDGKVGVDITEKMRFLVPKDIKDTSDVIQIDGEVVVPKDVPNARNYVAGSLNLKDIEEFKKRATNLCFVAYDLRGHPGRGATNLSWIILPARGHGDSGWHKWTQLLTLLSKVGFHTVLDENLDSIYPTDGEVHRVDDLGEWYKQGQTAHHPKGSIAFKVQKQGEETTLVDVIWQVGKSGVVSPVAILDPVMIEGANVSRATLHNIQYIRDLGLEIGCRVEVIRSGEIIPRIVRRVTEK